MIVVDNFLIAIVGNITANYRICEVKPLNV